MVRVMMAVLAVVLIVFQRDVEGKDALVAGRRGRCNKRIRVGRCKAHMTRWAWSQRKGKCVKFTYGGCKGNRNNFESRRECERKCEPNYNKPIKIVDCEDPTDPSLCAFNTADFSKAAFTMEDFDLPSINKADFNVKASFNKPGGNPDVKDGSFLPAVSKDGLMPPPDFIDGSFKPEINKGDLMPPLIKDGSSRPVIDKEVLKPNLGAFIKIPNVEEQD